MAGSRTLRTLRQGLVAGEVALALALLVAAGLLLRSFVLLSGVSPGFEPRGVMTAVLSLPTAQRPADLHRRGPHPGRRRRPRQLAPRPPRHQDRPAGGAARRLITVTIARKGDRMEQRVSLREVNQRLTRYVKAAEAGERIIITRRGKPVALLSSLHGQEKLLDAARQATLERILGQSHHLGGHAPLRNELHER